ncbi:nicotinate-nucleotide adenylyltransferase [Saliterribacillus persicus]|uniref:Probable nicotinate-nucleotide adenylyltransferase n=1 Tax=Saliterribacillus persicus TaxID=930114 RepID=A0A368XE40_9BACI|nr:nicotinate-nucleotide adenylyltransferase [Saliterribacillus persicus]RCW65298.1 nicotinate-nucleotide adenylyltransferase [Saliterribacillus persicus]
MSKKVGILGGTFDPPHIGHLLMAEEVYQALELDEIWFIPSNVPPHKSNAKTSVDNRVEMLEIAIANNRHFKIETIETERSGKSYTLDTIVALKERYKDYSFYFIIGADMVEYLPNWYHIDELVNLLTFVGVKRPGFNLTTTYPVKEVEIPIMEISSTMLRDRISNNKSIRYLTPDSVHRYIKENHLYE